MPWMFLQLAGKKPHQQQHANARWLPFAKQIIDFYRSRSGSSPKITEETDRFRSRKRGSAAEELFKNNYFSHIDSVSMGSTAVASSMATLSKAASASSDPSALTTTPPSP